MHILFARSDRIAVMIMAMTIGWAGTTAAQVRTDSGLIEGTASADGRISVFKGIPYAAPPIGELRWKPPQPVARWQGVHTATTFGARCTQGRIYDDMIFRDEMSEDCLYLNVWVPRATAGARLPVMVWTYGGGFQSGSASEPRQDGEQLAKKGVIVVSMNYRLGVFGFFSHPELTKESAHHASGNYAFLDQVAALQWVQKNIAAFGGNPRNVTIFGESTGSFAVSALMASPLSRALFQRAIGESGAFFTADSQGLELMPLAESERHGSAFAESLGATSIAALRAKPADEVLQAALKARPMRFTPNLDGYLLPRDVAAIYADGQQSHVPLLAGWNADEIRSSVTLAKDKPTAKTVPELVRARFGEHADAILKAYAAESDADVIESAAALNSDMFIGYSTWKWLEMHLATGTSPVYRYSFDQAPPIPPDTIMNGVAVTARDIGARHAGEIEYVFGALDSVPKVTWRPEDRTLSDVMMTYWTNFAKTGDPNGAGVPKWPAYDAKSGYQVQHLSADVHAAPDARRGRYEAIDAYSAKQRTH
jgi:para-nitrobenzyl esterase